mmetsp:Transcript_127176/g.271187  ORF Transcript_127176/g.271187 Transcript_127176/m.271187 type:complete len:203 (+) Transcript_127176:290-898(+)
MPGCRRALRGSAGRRCQRPRSIMCAEVPLRAVAVADSGRGRGRHSTCGPSGLRTGGKHRSSRGSSSRLRGPRTSRDRACEAIHAPRPHPGRWGRRGAGPPNPAVGGHHQALSRHHHLVVGGPAHRCPQRKSNLAASTTPRPQDARRGPVAQRLRTQAVPGSQPRAGTRPHRLGRHLASRVPPLRLPRAYLPTSRARQRHAPC